MGRVSQTCGGHFVKRICMGWIFCVPRSCVRLTKECSCIARESRSTTWSRYSRSRWSGWRRGVERRVSSRQLGFGTVHSCALNLAFCVRSVCTATFFVARSVEFGPGMVVLSHTNVRQRLCCEQLLSSSL